MTDDRRSDRVDGRRLVLATYAVVGRDSSMTMLADPHAVVERHAKNIEITSEPAAIAYFTLSMPRT